LNRYATFANSYAALHRIVSSNISTLVIGQNRISIPLIAKLADSGDVLLSALDTIRSATVGFLIVSLTNSGLIAILAIPTLLFRESRLLVITNIVASCISFLFAFVAALLLTVLAVGITSLLRDLGSANGLSVERGTQMLIFMWASWGAMAIVTIYWGTVWFVEVRRWSLVRKARTDEEIGDWRGMGKEVWRTFRRQKKQ
jgi:hypothetical protein